MIEEEDYDDEDDSDGSGSFDDGTMMDATDSMTFADGKSSKHKQSIKII